MTPTRVQTVMAAITIVVSVLALFFLVSQAEPLTAVDPHEGLVQRQVDPACLEYVAEPGKPCGPGLVLYVPYQGNRAGTVIPQCLCLTSWVKP